MEEGSKDIVVIMEEGQKMKKTVQMDWRILE